MSDTGGRRKPSDTAGRSTAGDEDHRGSLPLPAGLARLRQHGRRTFSADVSGAVALDEDANEKVTSRNQRRKRVGIIILSSLSQV